MTGNSESSPSCCIKTINIQYTHSMIEAVRTI